MAPTNDVQALTSEVRALRKTIGEERDATRRGNRTRNFFLVVVAALVALCLCLIVEINQARAEARVASCNGMNLLIDEINSVPETFGRGDFDLVSRRDCTPPGIRQFYDSGGKP